MTFRNHIKITLLSLVVLAVGIALFYHADRKKAVETLLQKGRTAIETKNMEKLMPLIALFYRDDLGLSYASLRGSFEYVFSQFNDIKIDYRIAAVTVGKDTSVADLFVYASGTWMGGTQDIAGKENEPLPVSILCIKEMFKWKVIGSRWPRGKAGLPGFN